MPPSQDPLYAGLGQAVRIGTELLAALIVGGGLGWVVDTYLLDSNPWGLVAGLGLGPLRVSAMPIDRPNDGRVNLNRMTQEGSSWKKVRYMRLNCTI
ncbi:MAG: AtpZ/AtpI family protein [Nitrospira sp.]